MNCARSLQIPCTDQSQDAPVFVELVLSFKSSHFTLPPKDLTCVAPSNKPLPTSAVEMAHIHFVNSLYHHWGLSTGKSLELPHYDAFVLDTSENDIIRCYSANSMSLPDSWWSPPDSISDHRAYVWLIVRALLGEVGNVAHSDGHLLEQTKPLRLEWTVTHWHHDQITLSCVMHVAPKLSLPCLTMTLQRQSSVSVMQKVMESLRSWQSMELQWQQHTQDQMHSLQQLCQETTRQWQQSVLDHQHWQTETMTWITALLNAKKRRIIKLERRLATESNNTATATTVTTKEEQPAKKRKLNDKTATTDSSAAPTDKVTQRGRRTMPKSSRATSSIAAIARSRGTAKDPIELEANDINLEEPQPVVRRSSRRSSQLTDSMLPGLD